VLAPRTTLWLAGVAERLKSGEVTLKLLALVAVPPAVVTVIGPLVAPLGTVVVIWLSESTVYVVVGVPLKATAVAPLKLAPLIVTVVPTGPLVGMNELIVGAGDVLPPVVKW
jgi:hypothetical protein